MPESIEIINRREIRKCYYEKNKEVASEQKRAYYARNREQILQRAKEKKETSRNVGRPRKYGIINNPGPVYVDDVISLNKSTEQSTNTTENNAPKSDSDSLSG